MLCVYGRRASTGMSRPGVSAVHGTQLLQSIRRCCCGVWCDRWLGVRWLLRSCANALIAIWYLCLLRSDVHGRTILHIMLRCLCLQAHVLIRIGCMRRMWHTAR